MEASLAHLLEGLVLLALAGAIGLLLNQRVQLVRIETLLTGADGRNGLMGDMRDLKAWRREIEEHALPRRLEELERRHGPEDRRATV
jgi:hypothetical protein